MRRYSTFSLGLCLVMMIASIASTAWAASITLTPTGSFALQRSSAAGIAADGSTLYVPHVNDNGLDTYSLSGAFLGSLSLSGVSTLLGGYTGAVNLDAGHLLLSAMYDDARDSAAYVFTKAGAFVSQVNFSPAIHNVTDIAFDGTNAYVNQNDSPNFAYRVDPVTGVVLQTYASNPGHGQRLGLAYWAGGGVLFESYDSGISVLDPATGSELQHYTSGDLGYAAQTFGVATLGNTLFTLTNTNVYTFEISAVPEPPAALLFGTGALLLLLLRGTPLARVLGSRC